MPQKYVILMMPRDRAYKNVPFEDVPPPPTSSTFRDISKKLPEKLDFFVHFFYNFQSHIFSDRDIRFNVIPKERPYNNALNIFWIVSQRTIFMVKRSIFMKFHFWVTVRLWVTWVQIHINFTKNRLSGFLLTFFQIKIASFVLSLTNEVIR